MKVLIAGAKVVCIFTFLVYSTFFAFLTILCFMLFYGFFAFFTFFLDFWLFYRVLSRPFYMGGIPLPHGGEYIQLGRGIAHMRFATYLETVN